MQFSLSLRILSRQFRSVGVITRNDGVVEVGVGFDETVDVSTLIPGNFSVLGGGSFTFQSGATNSYGDYQGVLLDTTGLTPATLTLPECTASADVYANVMPQTDVAL